MGRLARPASALVAATAAAIGALLAFHHPLWPGLLLSAFLGWCLLAAWRPGVWLLMIPACLPLLNFSPWSGWLSFEEFDLLLLGAIAAGHARLARRADGGAAGGTMAATPVMVAVCASLFVAASSLALWRGFADAGGFAFGWFQSHVEPMNSLRVFKPLLWALLLLPLTKAEIQASPPLAMRRLGIGMCLGLSVVTFVVLWERIAHPGLLNFSSPYRAVGLFWEMHVGGAAIDAYLAMAVPFAAWGLWSAKTPLQWSGVALLTLLAGHACLTTFSRGVYLAVAAPLLLLAVLLWRPDLSGSSSATVLRRALLASATAVLAAGAVVLGFALHGYVGAGVAGLLAALAMGFSAPRWLPLIAWRQAAGRGLAAALLVEVLAVMWTGSFLIERLAQSDRDLSSRIAHWAKGVALLHEPSDRAFGIGLGRLPAHYARFAPGHEFSGAVRLAPAAPSAAGLHGVRLSGPATQRQLEGLYSLTQRVPLLEGTQYRVDFDYRVQMKAGVFLGVCELHLLYERECQANWVDIAPGQSTWQHMSVLLRGPALTQGDWFAPRMAVFELSLLGAATEAEFTNLRLQADGARGLLRNGDFARGMAHWFPSAQGYFLPWHIDSLLLELWVERGPVALAAFLMLMAWTLRSLVRVAGRDAAMAPFLVASLSGVLLIGLLSSVMDAPRTAFLLFFLIGFSVLLCRSSAGEPIPDAAIGNAAVSR